jgi:acetolactate synthase-1/2/3 large subunit
MTLVDAASRGGLRVVHATRGAAACAMAAVTGLLTDAPGVALLTLDDREDQIVAALDQACRDGAPLVLVTERAFARPVAGIVKASLGVHADAGAHWSAHACQLALTEPRGPVHLVVTPDTAGAGAVPLATAVRPAPLATPEPAVLDGAADLLAQAQRPVLIAGRQCRTLAVATWLRALAEALPAPVLMTAGGKGALPDPHPLSLGLVSGRHAVHGLLQRADLAVAIGVDARELPPGTLPKALPMLHLAAAPWGRPELRMEVVGEIALLIEELAPRLRGRLRADWDVAELDRLKRAADRPLPADSALTISAVVRIVREATPAGTVAVAAADSATDAVVAAWQVVAPGELVVPAPPESPGFVLPAALAAALARPQARVVCFASARQVRDSEDALDLAANLALPVLVLVIGELDDAAAETPRCRGDGHAWPVMAARDPLGLRVAIERALSAGRPALLDVRGPRG